MRIEPVRRYPTPQLPTRSIVDEHPELLRLLPKRWQANPTVIAALTACLAMSSCRLSAESRRSIMSRPSLVAPLFDHRQIAPDAYPARSESYGAFGCVMVAPPRYLTEHDAERALKDEASRAGLRFAGRLLCLHNVEVPREPSPTSEQADKTKPAEPELFTLHFDGADTQRLIMFEYVSDTDLKNWKVTGTTEQVAERLRENLAKKQSPGTYAVFYGPDRVSGTSEEEVRQQMRDFIVWLKAQGVI